VSASVREIVDHCQQVRADARSMWLMAHQAADEARKMHQMLQPQVLELARTNGFRFKYRSGLLTQILAAAALNTGAPMGNIQLVQPETGELAIQAQLGFHRTFLEFFDCVASGHAACGVALQKQTRQLVEDVASCDIFYRSSSLEVLLDANVRAVQSTPLIGSSGNVIGILSTHYDKPRHFPDYELDVIDRYARSAVRIIEWFDRQPLPRGIPES